MLKQVLIAAGLTICAAGIASAQQSPTSAAAGTVTAAPTTLTAVAACEGQMRRLAGLNKALAANYNAQHTHDSCVANVGAGTDIASR
jgi:hypothetical protein